MSGLPNISSIRVLPRTAPDTVGTLPTNLHQNRAQSSQIGFAIAAILFAIFHPADLVFCGHVNFVPLAAFIAWLKRTKLIVQTHGIEVWGELSDLQRWGLERADLVLCVSRHTRGVVLGAIAIEPEKLLVVPNTVGTRYSPGDASRIRKSLGLEGKRVLLTVGRMDSRERYKGQDRVIAAIPTLISRGNNIAYIIVGSGDDTSRLKALAQDNGVASRVHFLGELESQALVDVFRAADLFVMPSTGEGFGIVFLEAMACGTPALGLAVAGACDALADGELGICVTEAELVNAIDRALAAPKNDGNLLATLVQARFGHDAFAKHVEAALGRMSYRA